MARFHKGQSGNPGGRPKAEGLVRDLAQQQTTIALRTLVECLDDANGRVRVSAAVALLDRGWGRPAQSIEVSSPDEEINVVERIRGARQRARASHDMWQEETRSEIQRQVLEQLGVQGRVAITNELLPSYHPFDDPD